MWEKFVYENSLQMQQEDNRKGEKPMNLAPKEKKSDKKNVGNVSKPIYGKIMELVDTILK